MKIGKQDILHLTTIPYADLCGTQNIITLPSGQSMKAQDAFVLRYTASRHPDYISTMKTYVNRGTARAHITRWVGFSMAGVSILSIWGWIFFSIASAS